MMQNLLPSETMLGAVALTVSDLGRSKAFYRDIIGLKIHRETAQSIDMGVGEGDLVILIEDKNAPPQRMGQGLYHFAIVVPSRLELAKTLYHLVQSNTPLQGLSDHFVSEAIYLADPDGIGIEIYRDLPRDQWRYSNNTLNIGTEPMDVDGVMGTLTETPTAWEGMQPGTRIGHVHLFAEDVRAAEHFYHAVVGFDVVIRLGNTFSFLAAGGYHHHLGVRHGRGKAMENAVGLYSYTVQLPDATTLDALQTRLQAGGYVVETDIAGAPFVVGEGGHRIRLIVS